MESCYCNGNDKGLYLGNLYPYPQNMSHNTLENILAELSFDRETNSSLYKGTESVRSSLETLFAMNSAESGIDCATGTCS